MATTKMDTQRQLGNRGSAAGMMVYRLAYASTMGVLMAVIFVLAAAAFRFVGFENSILLKISFTEISRKFYPYQRPFG